MAFDYFDKVLLALSTRSGFVSIVSFATVIGAPVGIARASFSLVFSINNRIAKNLLKTMRRKKQKHNKIVLLTRSKVNNIKTQYLKH